MKWGRRWGEFWGRTADGHAASGVSGLRLVADPGSGLGAFLVSWTWAGGKQKWGFRWGHRWGRTPAWFKVYVNGTLYATTIVTRLTINLGRDPGQITVAVVACGPLNGDEAYDPAIELTAVPGNRARLAWAPPANSDLSHFHLYWDAGDGSIDYVTPLADIQATGASAYQWTSAPLANGNYLFALKSVDSAGNESPAAAFPSVAIASWPAAPTGLAYAYSAVTKKVTLSWTGGATVNVYGNGGSGDIDYTTPVASSQTTPWLSGVLTGPGTFRYAVRADDGTYEEQNLVYVEFELDVAEAEVSRPASPYGLTVVPSAGGTFTVSGFLDPRRTAINGRTPAAAAAIKLYHDNGTGTMDWVTPIATVTLTVAAGLVYAFSQLTAAYADGLEVQFGARAATAGGVTDENTDTESGVADATAPAVPTGLTASAVRDSWGG